MAPTLLFYQLLLVALVLICLVIQVWWPDHPMGTSHRPLKPDKLRLTENRILRQRSKGRVQMTDSDRYALAEIATAAKPDTILAWHRKFVFPPRDISQQPKSVGRPRMNREIEDLVVRMARENRSWGYDRIVGALANLGSTMSDQTVGNILKRHSISPAPERTKTVTWREFIRFHLDVLPATDFFTKQEVSRLPQGGDRVRCPGLSACTTPTSQKHFPQSRGIVMLLPMVSHFRYEMDLCDVNNGSVSC